MRVTEDHQVQLRPAGEERACVRRQTFGPLAIVLGARTSPGGRAADAAGEREEEIGRHEAEEGAERRATGRALENPVAQIAPEKAVAVCHVGPTGGDGDLHRPVEQLDADLVGQKAPHPCVVVADDEPHPHTGVDQFRETAQNPEASPRDDVVVLEPEIEQVAVDQQLVSRSRQGLQERNESPLRVGRNLAEVNVGDDDGSTVGYARR